MKQKLIELYLTLAERANYVHDYDPYSDVFDEEVARNSGKAEALSDTMVLMKELFPVNKTQFENIDARFKSGLKH